MLVLALSVACTSDPVDSALPMDTAPVDTVPTDTDTDTAPTDTTPTDTGPDDSGKTEDTGDPEDTGEEKEWGWRSALYPSDWTPEHTDGEHFLHDFSYAGYHNGEDALPEPSGTVFDVTVYGADATGSSDSNAAIQAAIDAASVSGGVVYLPTGEYRCDSLLTVTASGVHITGDGPGKTKLFFTLATGVSDVNHLSFTGSLAESDEVLLTADGESRSKTVTVADTAAFSVGDDVSVGWVISDAFVEEHGMADTWWSFNGLWRPFFRRTVVAVDAAASTLTLDVPLRYPAQMRDDASVRLESGYISEVSASDLSVSTVADWSDAWSNDRSHAIGMTGVRDGFIDNVVSYESPNSSDTRGSHLQSGGVIVVHSKRVTVASSTMENAQHRGDGGNGYLFEVSRSAEVLFVDLVGRAGRHNFIQNWDFGASGIVWLRTSSEEGAAVYSEDLDWLTWLGTSEFHHSLAMANLIDSSTTTDGWKAANRNDYSSGAGHTATQSVFWNTAGSGSLSSYQYGNGYIIGTTDVAVDTTVYDVLDSAGTAPEDYSEGLDEGETLNPQSLYEDQLAKRLARGEGLW
ncbi:MAG: glycosyl hydrolase family 28-related protein [Myxococcota bacterium]|nr:glycosyl hydrolase family 28-related protein [Myxococcota bacterium]